MGMLIKRLPWVLLTVIWVLVVLAVIITNRQHSGTHYVYTPPFDPSALRLTLTNIETGKPSINPATFNRQTCEFNWTPAKGDAGTYRVKVTAVKDGQHQEEIITVVVKEQK